MSEVLDKHYVRIDDKFYVLYTQPEEGRPNVGFEEALVRMKAGEVFYVDDDGCYCWGYRSRNSCDTLLNAAGRFRGGAPFLDFNQRYGNTWHPASDTYTRLQQMTFMPLIEISKEEIPEQYAEYWVVQAEDFLTKDEIMSILKTKEGKLVDEIMEQDFHRMIRSYVYKDKMYFIQTYKWLGEAPQESPPVQVMPIKHTHIHWCASEEALNHFKKEAVEFEYMSGEHVVAFRKWTETEKIEREEAECCDCDCDE